MIFVFFLLCGVILTYWYLTDSRRVRAMAQNYLSQLTGGHVEVRGATLSIFEGLRLDGVTVRVDEDHLPDSTIFKAGTILIKYNPQSILNGRLEATQIVALDPQVFLCEDLDHDKWNWQRAVHHDKSTTRAAPGPRMKFPEILLRNAQLNYSRLRGGKLLNDRGLMDIEGSLKPGADGGFSFLIQSRGESDSMGPVVEGDFNMYTKAVSARLLHDFHFGKEIEVMLPEQVRNWWIAHGLSGNLEIAKFQVRPGAAKDHKSAFRIETVLHDVNLTVQPEEWLSREEVARLQAMRRTMASMKSLGMDDNGFVSRMQSFFDPSAIALSQVTGRFIFTEDGIDFSDLNGVLEHDNLFDISGHIDGYSAEAPASIVVRGDKIMIPETPRYLNSMPPAFRELYEHLRPKGTGSLLVTIDRPTAGAKPKVTGKIGIAEGSFTFDAFPYPLRKVMGEIVFGWNEKRQMECVDVTMQGLGVMEGPNKDVRVDVRGFVGPLGNGEAEFDFHVTTNGVTSEGALTAAFPAPVREALKIFDAPGKGEFPQYHGGFSANVRRPGGPAQKWSTVVDVVLDDARGSLSFFPYPVEHLTGKLHITDDHVDLNDILVRKGESQLMIDGVVHFERDKPIEPKIHLAGKNIPIDSVLIAALPKDRRQWVEKVGLGGKIDVEGVIERAPSAGKTTVAGAAHRPEDDIAYDLQLALREGTIWPVDGMFAATELSGRMHLTPSELVLTEMKGRRGKATIAGSGRVHWSGTPWVEMAAEARNLQLDAALYKLLPPSWRGGWDQARPEGSVNLSLNYTGGFDSEGVEKKESVAARPAEKFEAVIHPVKLAMTPRILPCRIEELKGEILIRPELITLKELTATRKSGGKIWLSGTMPAGDAAGGAWDLTMSAKNLASDKELRQALPPAVGKLLESMSFAGKLNVDLTRLTYRGGKDPKQDDGTLDFAGKLALVGNSFEVGAPITDAVGSVSFEGSARGGKLGGLAGSVDLSSLTLGGRVVKNFRCELIKPELADALRIGKISGEVAGGALAGQVDLIFPDKGPARFALALVLRNADVRTLTGMTEKDIKGEVTASLAIDGNWGDPTTRRGRGDVSVSGKEMYKIPLMLGLMQITNLTLPISSPFNEAAARYNVEGEKVTFEQIEIRASNMLMSGSGWLDFKSKKVKMSFVTDNPNAWRIPFISDILQGARQEFMQIHVSGSVQEPKVSGAMMNTFSTTVDEVFKGDRRGEKR